MLNSFTFNGKCSTDFGVVISKKKIHNAPASDIEFVSVPGRNGDIITSKKRFENIEVVYSCWVKGNIEEKSKAIKAWLKSTKSYARLSDTYDDDYYRLAVHTDNIEFDADRNTAEFDAVFNCKPFKCLNSGDNATSFTTSGGTITNSEGFPSRPLLQVWGTAAGTVTIGSKSISISSFDCYVMIDCETQNAYKGTTNKNSTINTADLEIPSGDSTVSFTGGISAVSITPRWVTL